MLENQVSSTREMGRHLRKVSGELIDDEGEITGLRFARWNRGDHFEAGQYFVDYLGGVAGTATLASGAASAGSARLGAGAASKICSFTEDTPVLMCDGSLKPIQHVRAGEFVLSRSEETGEFGCREVVEPYANPDRAILRIELLAADGAAEIIEATANHPFYVEGQGWTRVDELDIGDFVPGSIGEHLRVVALESTHRVETVYNFGVLEFHSYFVGVLGAWVHNCNPNIKGGRYGQVRDANIGGEVHHMPADSVSPLPRRQGPAILMEKADHMKTQSWGPSGRAMKYRKKQKELIDKNRFDDAIQMNIDDIQLNFDSKYDDAILQMIDSLP